jgi:TRAP-type C4-dicarboxylate transport system permease small subunit
VSGAPELAIPVALVRSSNKIVAALEALLEGINKAIMAASALALLAAAFVLTESVFVRYFLKATTDWQDEATIFLLVGATFLSAAYIQSQRGHIGIEALSALLPPAVNRARLFLVDVASFLFCAFFSWKSWTLTHEAFAEGQVTSSTWAPPLAIPYGMMALGMTLLTLQILVQILAAIARNFDKSEVAA